MSQIGTIHLQANSEVVKVPVYDTSDLGDRVYDMVRVQTPSGVGFIPFTNANDASYPYLRLQTQNNGVIAAHNEPHLIHLMDGDIIDNFDGNKTYTWNYGNPFNYTSERSVEGGYSAYVQGNQRSRGPSYSNEVPSPKITSGSEFSFRVYPTNTSDTDVKFLFWSNATADTFDQYCNYIEITMSDGLVSVGYEYGSGGSGSEVGSFDISSYLNKWLVINGNINDAGDNITVSVLDSHGNELTSGSSDLTVFPDQNGGHHIGWDMSLHNNVKYYFDSLKVR